MSARTDDGPGIAGRSTPLLAYVEHCLPAADVASRLALARAHGLALEVAHRPETDVAAIARSGARIATLMAWELHERHALSPERSARAAAARHVRATLALAAAHGIPRVLVVPGYGPAPRPDPFRDALELFRPLVAEARVRGVRLLLELLSPLRAAALATPDELLALVRALDAPDVVGTVLDLGHLADAGLDPGPILERWDAPLDELQLRGAASRPPAEDLPLRALLGRARDLPRVISVEHRAPTTPDAVQRLVAHVRRELAP